MAFSPQNFRDGIGPAISSAWLNELDQLANNALQSAVTVPALQAVLGIPVGGITFPVPVNQGGTGSANGSGTVISGLVDSGAANAYVVSVAANAMGSPAALSTGQLFVFIAAHPNNGPSTLAAGGTPATAIIGHSGNPLVGGEIITTDITILRNNGVAWQIISPTQASIGTMLYPQTPAEAAVPVVPLAFQFPPGDLRRYGGVSGNATLDTAAWLAAVAQASQFANGAAAIFVPTTTAGFLINTGATATRPIKIFGNGYLNSLLIAQADITMLTLNASGGANAAFGCRIQDVGFTGVYAGATQDGITFLNSHDTILDGVRITGFGIGLDFFSGSSFCVKVLNSRIEGNRNRNINAAAQTHALSLINVALGSSGTNLSPIGMSHTDSNSLFMFGCDLEGLRGAGTVVGIDIDATSTIVGDHVICCHFENNANTVGEIRVGATSQVQGINLFGTIMANSAAGAIGLNLVKAAGVSWPGVSFFSNFGTANIQYGTVSKTNIIPGDALTTQGVAELGNGNLYSPLAANAAALVNGGTITTLNTTVVRCTIAGGANVNSIKLQSGPGTALTGAQECTLINESAFTISFDIAANSNVADGAASAIPALTSRKFTWDPTTSLWYRAA